ncbi:MAG: hypothetical protein CSA49_00880 [Gammaproteobacteria bacterium]|nr:MAG: hypothetical protein CSA49_00880 [Gammaproteobacteria bacterium]
MRKGNFTGSEVAAAIVQRHTLSRKTLKKLNNAVAAAFCLVFLLVCSLAGNVYAGSIVIDQERFHINATDKIEYIEDTTGQLKANDLIHPSVARQFARIRSTILPFGFTNNTIWMRINIENHLPKMASAIMYIDRPDIDNISLYVVENNQVKPYALTPETGRSPAFLIDLKANESTVIFAKLTSYHFINAAIKLSDPISYSVYSGILQMLIGWGAGIIFCLLVYGLYQSLRTRARIYYFFTLYLSSSLLYTLTHSGYIGFQWLAAPGIYPKLEAAGLLLTVAAITHLEWHFLRAAKPITYVNYSLRGMSLAALLVLTAIPFIDNNTSIQIGFIVGIIAAPMLLFAAFVHWANGFKPALYHLTSRSFFLILAGIAAQTLYGNLPINITLSWLLLFGFVADAVLVNMALTERQRLIDKEQEEQRCNAAVKIATIRTKSEFLSQLSHEIRTPMNGILGMAELLNGTSLSHIQQDYLKTISTSGNHLLKILDDVLDFSRIEAGKLSIDIAPFDISLLLSESIELLNSRIEEKQLELITHIDSNVPQQLKGDPIRIRQILINLISNAVNYTDHGDIAINIQKAPSSSRLELQFEVSGSGINVPQEILKTLFQHSQLINPADNKALGLAIAERLVNMMNGKIGVESQQGKGCRFWFTLPLEATEEERTPVFSENFQDLRLLVVDDNASCRLVIQQQANSWGMNVSTALNGKQALALLRTQANLEEPFDIVIVDHEMPGMNGLELAARIKEDPLINNNLLVIMLTGLGVAPSSTAARNAGIRRVITKPVTGRVLKATLAEELDHLQKIEQAHPKTGADEPPLSNKINILVAEDHHLSQKVIKGMLARLGLDCDTVSNGKEAIEATLNNDYSLILMDCEMPDVNGYEATRKIRSLEKAHHKSETPIIALTAHIMDEHKERSLQCGMNAHLSKPIELSELRDIIIRWTEQPADKKPPNSHQQA